MVGEVGRKREMGRTIPAFIPNAWIWSVRWFIPDEKRVLSDWICVSAALGRGQGAEREEEGGRDARATISPLAFLVFSE